MKLLLVYGTDRCDEKRTDNKNPQNYLRDVSVTVTNKINRH